MRWHHRLALGLWLLAALPALGHADAGVRGAIAFSDDPGHYYLPLQEVARPLGLKMRRGRQGSGVWLNGHKVPPQQVRLLCDGTPLIRLSDLKQQGLSVGWEKKKGAVRVAARGEAIYARAGRQRVAISRREQRLRAWQGKRLVLSVRCSTGRKGMETPKGSFRTGPLKWRELISKKYDNAKMPWSVQFGKDGAIHGFPSVPGHAASHGCIRLPLTGGNPAKWFFRWVYTGTPVKIADGWPSWSSHGK